MLDQSVIIIRNEDGKIYAHHNSCRHRGSAICVEERGHEDKLKCPYHNWVYDKTGRLGNARLMPDDFDKSQFGLHPYISPTWRERSLFPWQTIRRTSHRESADLAPYLQPYQLEKQRLLHRDRYELEANWKPDR